MKIKKKSDKLKTENKKMIEVKNQKLLLKKE